MKSGMWMPAALTLLFGALGQAHAGLIFNTLLSDPYQAGGGPTVSGAGSFTGYIQNTDSFIPVQTGILGDIKLGVFNFEGSPVFDVTLRDGNNTLETWVGVVAPSFNPSSIPTLVVNSVVHPTLYAGVSYDLTVAPGADSTFGVWIEDWGAREYHHQYRVQGSVAPEPASLGLLGLGAAGLLGLTFRRKDSRL